MKPHTKVIILKHVNTANKLVLSVKDTRSNEAKAILEEAARLGIRVSEESYVTLTLPDNIQ